MEPSNADSGPVFARSKTVGSSEPALNQLQIDSISLSNHLQSQRPVFVAEAGHREFGMILNICIPSQRPLAHVGSTQNGHADKKTKQILYKLTPCNPTSFRESASDATSRTSCAFCIKSALASLYD